MIFSEEAGRVILNPGKKYLTDSRIWQGCPTIAQSKKGRLFAGWFSGVRINPDFSSNFILNSRF